MRPANWLVGAALLASFLIISQTAGSETVSKPKLFPVEMLDSAKAEERGYTRLSVDLGTPGVSFSALVKKGVTANRFDDVAAIETPGRGALATLFAPAERNAFQIAVTVFSVGVAAEAAAASEQLLFEGGYKLADARHPDLVSGESFGLIRESGQPARAARSICAVRGVRLVCFLIEFDADHERAAMEQAAVFAGSIAFEDGKPNAFAPDQIAELELPLGQGETLALRRPSGWDVDENSFQGELPGVLGLRHGPKENPTSGLVITASAGAPPKADALEAVAGKLIGKYVKDNAHLFEKPELVATENVRGLDPAVVSSASFVYVVDKIAGPGKAQLRLALVATGNRRYSVLLVTHYSEELDETGPFFVRLAGVTAYDLAMESLVAQAGPK